MINMNHIHQFRIMILNSIQRRFSISLKDMILNDIQIYDFKFH